MSCCCIINYFILFLQTIIVMTHTYVFDVEHIHMYLDSGATSLVFYRTRFFYYSLSFEVSSAPLSTENLRFLWTSLHSQTFKIKPITVMFF